MVKYLSDRQNNLTYPSENLVIYIHYIFSGQDVSSVKLLDYGFGSGNNLKHFSEYGFDVYGTEISEDAKRIALSKLPLGFDVTKLILNNENDILPFEDFFLI